jgi:tetratricopeptide (TPR) repeat protein
MYHNATLKYNIYFNGNEAYKRGIIRINSQNTDNYNEILSVFVDSKEELAGSAGGDMDKAIQKSAKGIKIHSITKKPEIKKSGNMSKKEKEFFDQKEFNKWIDDCYLLMGKSYFIKREYLDARQNFDYLVRQFPNDETRHIANLYLARTYCEQSNFKAAKETLDFIEAEKELPKKFDGLFAAIYADYYIKQKQYEAAIPKLQRAIKNTKSKKDKLRYTYILAQIYEKLENLSKASELYANVAKKNSSYEMEFNAKINMAKCFVGQGKSNKDIRKTLKKMLRDDKNIEYLDQVYYAIAEIDFRSGQKNEAIENYKLSSENSISNDFQKALSCLKLGEIYFAKLDYNNAQIYYDTCMAFLPITYDNYRQIKSNSHNLNELIEYTSLVEFEDSVQTLAKLSEKERNKIIDKIIADLVEQERVERELEQQSNINSMLFDQQRGNSNNNVNAPGGGKWYFYNPSQLSFGKNEFNKKWGQRKNEDNWRRKNKSVVDFNNEDLAEGQDSASSPLQNRLTNTKDRAYYLQDIPLTDSAMTASNEEMIEGLFNVGRIYKEKFSDYDKAIDAYEKLNKRFPNNEYLLLSYYNLYLLNKLSSNNSEMEKYKNLVIAKYPDTNYAKLLQNPNYIRDLESKRHQDIETYIETYDRYMASDCSTVNINCNKYLDENPNGELRANFDFFKTLCVGRNSDTTVFKIALVKYIQKYPENELSTAAQNILAYFGTTNIQELIADLQQRPDATIQTDSTYVSDTNSNTIVAPKENYEFNEDMPHYYVIYVKSEQVDIKRLSFEIRNFNIFNFSMRTFIVNNVTYDGAYEFVTVKPFKNKTQSVNYSKLIANSDDVFNKLKNADHQIFVISENNLVKLKKNKDIQEYLKFYRENY